MQAEEYIKKQDELDEARIDLILTMLARVCEQAVINGEGDFREVPKEDQIAERRKKVEAVIDEYGFMHPSLVAESAGISYQSAMQHIENIKKERGLV